MILHDATEFHEGDEIGVKATAIVDYGPEHKLMVTGTRVVLSNGDQLVVRETVEEITALIAAEVQP